jgi:hypothetical protein
MHVDLHPNEHLPHLVHLLSSNLILNIDTFERSPSKVPTGQIMLQYRRPFIKDRIPTRKKNSTGIEYVSSGKPLIVI